MDGRVKSFEVFDFRDLKGTNMSLQGFKMLKI